jgi:hypothetical protein
MVIGTLGWEKAGISYEMPAHAWTDQEMGESRDSDFLERSENNLTPQLVAPLNQLRSFFRRFAS